MAGAPAVDLAGAAAPLPVEVQEPFWVTLIAGYGVAYPDAEAAAADLLTPAGQALVDRLDASCQDDMVVEPGVPLLEELPSETEPWSTLLADNVPGDVAAPAPLLIVHGDQDRQVPVATSATLLDRLCAVGQVTERRIVPGVDHVIAAVPAYEQALAWFDDLRDGADPASSCP